MVSVWTYEGGVGYGLGLTDLCPQFQSGSIGCGWRKKGGGKEGRSEMEEKKKKRGAEGGEGMEEVGQVRVDWHSHCSPVICCDQYCLLCTL